MKKLIVGLFLIIPIVVGMSFLVSPIVEAIKELDCTVISKVHCIGTYNKLYEILTNVANKTNTFNAKEVILNFSKEYNDGRFCDLDTTPDCNVIYTADCKKLYLSEPKDNHGFLIDAPRLEANYSITDSSLACYLMESNYKPSSRRE